MRCCWRAECWGSLSSLCLRTGLCLAHNSPDTLFTPHKSCFFYEPLDSENCLLFSRSSFTFKCGFWHLQYIGVGWRGAARKHVYCAMAENKLIRCPCSVWPTVLKPPAKVIYDPVKRTTGWVLEGWISGLGIATIFHHYQAIPGGLVKHLVIPHLPVRHCWPFYFVIFLTWDKIESTPSSRLCQPASLWLLRLHSSFLL